MFRWSKSRKLSKLPTLIPVSFSSLFCSSSMSSSSVISSSEISGALGSSFSSSGSDSVSNVSGGVLYVSSSESLFVLDG